MVLTAPEMDDHATPSWHPEHRGRLDAVLAAIDEGGLRRRDRVAGARARLRRRARARARRRATSRRSSRSARPVAASSTPTRRPRRARGPRPAAAPARCSVRSTRCAARSAMWRSLPAARPGITPCATGRWASACSTTPRSAPPSWPRRGERVAIVDWDVHHGNGTQDIFYDDPRVLYVSTHESPLYPGTGQLRERGAGEGEGANLNLPFPAGTAGDTYRAAFDEVVVPDGRAVRSRLADHLRRVRRASQRPARRSRAHERRLRRPGATPPAARAGAARAWSCSRAATTSKRSRTASGRR